MIMKKIWLLLIMPVTMVAQKNYPQLLDDYMQAELKIKQFNGAVVVIQKEKVIYKKAFGLADREWDVGNTIDTKFRIGSITKQFTAACIMQLAEQGKLSVDDKLTKYFPDYPKGDSVTIHMLLNHTSGIMNYTNIPEFWPKAVIPLSIDSMIAVFKNKPYDFSPGMQWNYSNSGYFLLGVIVEKASGKKFRDYLWEHVIQKAGLKNTDMDRLDSLLTYRAKGYAKTPTGWRHANYISMESPFSAGAMFSTLNDLYNWMQALMHNKIVSPASTQKMMTPYLRNYGYGLIIDSLKQHKRIWHNGGIPGFASHLAYYPADEVYVAALSNNESNADKIGMSLAFILFNIPVMMPYIPKAIKIDPAILDSYIGKYMATTQVELVKVDNILYRRRKGAPDIELKPETITRFFYADGSDRFIEFELDKTGKAKTSYIIINGEKTEMKKLE